MVTREISNVAASLAAAISLLETAEKAKKSPKLVVASNRMFSIMIADYKRSLKAFMDVLKNQKKIDEETAKAIVPAIQAALSQMGIDRSQMTDHARLHVAKVAIEAVRHREGKPFG